MPASRVSALVVLVAVGGCAHRGGLSLGEFEARVAAAVCHRDGRCGAIAASEEGRCASDAAAERSASRAIYSVEEAIAHGRLAFDGAGARACLDAWNLVGCAAAASGVLPACRGVYRGRVAVGGECRRSQECDGGWCEHAGDGCPGLCRAFAPTGSGCLAGSTALCGPHDYCDAATETCLARRGPGGACAVAGHCLDGLRCIDGACRAPGEIGARCSADDPESCTAGLYCNTDGAAWACAPRLARDADCASAGRCGDGLACVGLLVAQGVVPGACARWLDLGAACDPAAASTGCPADARCDAATRSCRATHANEGDACAGDGACAAWPFAPPLRCDGGRCVPRTPPGGSCSPSSDGCRAGRCDPRSFKCTRVCE